MEKHNARGRGLGGDLQGPTIKRIINSEDILNDLESILVVQN